MVTDKRVEKGEKYFYVNDIGKLKRRTECLSVIDEDRFELGNYFHDPHMAVEFAIEIHKLFRTNRSI